MWLSLYSRASIGNDIAPQLVSLESTFSMASSQVKNYSPVYMKQNAAINTGPAHGVGGLCECVRCSSSWKAAWAECTCAGAARLAIFSFFFFSMLFLPRSVTPTRGGAARGSAMIREREGQGPLCLSSSLLRPPQRVFPVSL